MDAELVIEFEVTPIVKMDNTIMTKYNTASFSKIDCGDRDIVFVCIVID